MNWNATNSDIQEPILRNWLPINWNSNKSNRTIRLWNLSEGQIMKKQRESIACGEHLIWPHPHVQRMHMSIQCMYTSIQCMYMYHSCTMYVHVYTLYVQTDRQIASLTVQCRQVYCLVEMAPSVPSWRPPHRGVSSTASQAGENDQTNVATQQWFQAFSTYPTLRNLAEEE